MDPKVQLMLEKARVFADKTGKAAIRVADTASKKANEMAQATRWNLQIFDLNTECELIYKEIGKLIYDIHRGVDSDEDGIEERINHLDDNRAQVEELKQRLAETKTTCSCPNCGRVCGKESAFCPGCGAQL